MTGAAHHRRRDAWLRAAATGVALLPLAGRFIDGAPWSTLAAAVAAVATLHGLGRGVGRLAGDDAAPWIVATAWGLAAYLGAAGILIAVGVFTPLASLVIEIAGCSVGAWWVGRRGAELVTAPRAARLLRGMSPGLVLVVLAPLWILGAAGGDRNRADEDTSVAAELARLDDTGAAGDGVSFARSSGLGGAIAIARLGGRDASQTAAMIEAGVLLVLVVAWVIHAAQRAGGSLAALALPLALAVLPLPHEDACWSLTLLLLGAASTLERAIAVRSRRLILVVVVLAAALTVTRHAAAVAGLVLSVTAVLAQRSWSGRALGWWRPLTLGILVPAPYAASLIRGWTERLDPALSASYADGLVVRGALAAALGAALGALALLVTRPAQQGPATAWRAGLCAAAACIGAAGFLSPGQPSMVAAIAAAATAFALLVAVPALAHLDLGDGDAPAAGARVSPVTSIALALAVCAAVSVARFPAGSPPVAWWRRQAALGSDAGALGLAEASSTPRLAAAYRAAQDAVPGGQPVGAWVTRPDLLDHRRHRVVDLSALAARRCGRATRWPRCPALPAAVEQLGLRYVLIADELAPLVDRPSPPGGAGVHVLDVRAAGPAPHD